MVAPGFFHTAFDLKLLFLFAFKRGHKLFMCSLHDDVLRLAPQQRATVELKLFAFMYHRREIQHVQSVIQFFWSLHQNGYWRGILGKKTEGHSPVIAGIKLKRTVSFITEPSWEIVSILYFCVPVCCFRPSRSVIYQAECASFPSQTQSQFITEQTSPFYL